MVHPSIRGRTRAAAASTARADRGRRGNLRAVTPLATAAAMGSNSLSTLRRATNAPRAGSAGAARLPWFAG
jgi:hypothetical protein